MSGTRGATCIDVPGSQVNADIVWAKSFARDCRGAVIFEFSERLLGYEREFGAATASVAAALFAVASGAAQK